MDTQQFLEKHGMNYSVTKVPAAIKNIDGSFSTVDNQFHLVRSSDQKVVSDKTVSRVYQPYDPRKMSLPLAPLVAEGWISPDRGFLFKDGSYEVLSYRIDAGQLENGGNVAGEKWTHYVSLHNNHGNGGLKGSLHSLRIQCQNSAYAAAKMASFTIRHSSEIEENYQEAVRTWKKLQEEIRRLSERVSVWADTQISPSKAREIFSVIFKVEGLPEEDISTRTENEMKFAWSQFSNPEFGTYGASLADIYNAITATNTHYSVRESRETEEKKNASLFIGTRYDLEARTVSILDRVLA